MTEAPWLCCTDGSSNSRPTCLHVALHVTPLLRRSRLMNLPTETQITVEISSVWLRCARVNHRLQTVMWVRPVQAALNHRHSAQVTPERTGCCWAQLQSDNSCLQHHYVVLSRHIRRFNQSNFIIAKVCCQMSTGPLLFLNNVIMVCLDALMWKYPANIDTETFSWTLLCVKNDQRSVTLSPAPTKRKIGSSGFLSRKVWGTLWNSSQVSDSRCSQK